MDIRSGPGGRVLPRKGYTMNTSKALAVALSIGLASFAATSQTTTDHSQHTAGAAAPAAQTPAAAATDQQVSAMDKHMRHMRAMSSKMAEAKTPQERQALMAEHKKAMHDGMAMMAGSGTSGGTSAPPTEHAGGHSTQPGGMGAAMMHKHAMMEKRMEMMQATMQLMMDHMHTPAPK